MAPALRPRHPYIPDDLAKMDAFRLQDVPEKILFAWMREFFDMVDARNRARASSPTTGIGNLDAESDGGLDLAKAPSTPRVPHIAHHLHSASPSDRSPSSSEGGVLHNLCAPSSSFGAPSSLINTSSNTPPKKDSTTSDSDSRLSPSMDYSRSEPIAINNRSPGSQTSSLTTQLRMQDFGGDQYQNSTAIDDGYREDLFGGDGRDPINGGFPTDTRPIMMHNRRRRESNNVDNWSNGMSLQVVGSWIRDEVAMGTSPGNGNAIQLSASHQSSSYLPRQESAFMSDFSCCNTVFPTLHELISHREQKPQAHQPSEAGSRNFAMSNGNGMGSSHLGLSQPFTSAPSTSFNSAPRGQNHSESSRRAQQQQLATIVDDDGLDMDLDDPSFNTSATAGASQDHSNSLLQSVTGTPMPSYAALMNNPTVSSVNTPSIGTQQTSPQDMSAMGPSIDDYGAFDNFNMFGNPLDGISMFEPNAFSQHMSGLTIQNPGSQLTNLSANGGQFALPLDGDLTALTPHQLQGLAPAALFPFQQAPEDKKFKCPHGHANQKLLNNEDGTFSIVNPDTSQPYPGSAGMEKEKPYKCETCGKRYKNLNGLKYHRTHNAPCNPELISQYLQMNGLSLPPHLAGQLPNTGPPLNFSLAGDGSGY